MTLSLLHIINGSTRCLAQGTAHFQAVKSTPSRALGVPRVCPFLRDISYAHSCISIDTI